MYLGELKLLGCKTLRADGYYSASHIMDTSNIKLRKGTGLGWGVEYAWFQTFHGSDFGGGMF